MSLGSGLNHLGETYIMITTNIDLPGSGSELWINELMLKTESLGVFLYMVIMGVVLN